MLRTLRPMLALLVAVGFASAATAQLSQVCFNDSIPLQPTNWMQNVTLPKFNPNLGTLQSIDFTLSATATGAARVESLDNSPTLVTLTFQSTVTLTRPDNSVIVVTIPQVQFMDPLSAADGIIDFAGTAGESHENLMTTDSDSVTSPPPPSDLALFTGAGTISLPVVAAGASTAQGGGNVISQFVSNASAQVTICYNYIPNTPPSFVQSPCNTQLMASVGVPFSVQICAADIELTDTVTLTAVTLPAGATLLPPLPAAGNPVCTTVSWTPANDQVGVSTFTFIATDTHARQTTCSFTVLVAECHVVLGQALAGAPPVQVNIFGHMYDTQLSTFRRSAPVTMTDIPYITLPTNGRIAAQVLMYNPLIFPTNPSQWSRVCDMTMNANGTLSTVWSGTRNGITLRPTTQVVSGQTRITCRFTIDGM